LLGFAGLFTSNLAFQQVMSLLLPLVLLIVGLFLVFLFFKMGRRYIAIGIFISSLLPLLIFGACFFILFGMSAGLGG